MGTCAAAGFADVEVGDVVMGCDDHAAGTEGDSVVETCGNIVGQLVNGGCCGLSGNVLL